MDKQIRMLKRSALNSILLDNIKVGDLIADEFGKKGKVSGIEKVNRNQQSHYYFHLHKNGTILFIL